MQAANFTYPFIIESSKSLVRAYGVSADGIPSLATGTDAMGFSSDGGPAAAVQLNQPRGIAVDSAGALYISAIANHRIRKVEGAMSVATFFPQIAVGNGWTTLFTITHSFKGGLRDSKPHGSSPSLIALTRP